MEFDTPARPLHTTADVSTGGLTVYSMEDYMATHGSAFKAEQAAAAASKIPPQKKMKSANIANSLNPNNAAFRAAYSAGLFKAAPVPVAIGARSSTHIVHLHEKAQAYGLERPEFVYEGDSVRGWCVWTSFLGQQFGPLGPFSTKQQGKEALSGKALEFLLEMEKDGGFAKDVKEQKKAKMQEKAEKKVKEAGPNYVGLLLEFQRARSCPQPLYTDYNLGTQFSCLVTLEELTSHPEPFGSTSDLFPSKKAARQHAASCAIAYFKTQGIWPENVSAMGGIKKKKVVQPPPPPKSRARSNTSISSSSSTENTPASPSGTTYPQQAAELSIALGLGTPEWRIHASDPAARDFHTVACYFKYGGPHGGPIGEVRNIFGKKKAKEECARLTVAYLQDVKQRRLEFGARMMASAQAGSGPAKEDVQTAEAVGSGPAEEAVQGAESSADDLEEEKTASVQGGQPVGSVPAKEDVQGTQPVGSVPAKEGVQAAKAGVDDLEEKMQSEMLEDADSDVEFEDAMEEL